MARLKSPEQVKRIDGRGCFMEVLTTGLSIDKICMNFVQYNTSAVKGSRIASAVMVYLDVHKADIFAEMILSGKMAKLGEKSKADAAAKGAKYAREVFRDLTGTPASRSKRSDGKPMSRQFKLTPGSSQAWVLSAETGEGKETATGAIAPAYTGRPEVIVRIPLSDDDLKGLALTFRNLIQMWYSLKFMPVAAKDVAKLEPGKPVYSVKAGDSTLNVSVDAIGIDQIKVTMTGKSKSKFDLYLNTNKAQVLAQDLLSGRILKQKAAEGEELHTSYVTYGGGRHGSDIICRTFEIVVSSDGRYAVHGAVGPGKLTGDGRIEPDGKAKRSTYVQMDASELQELGYVLRGIAQAWTVQKFGALIADDIDRVRNETRQAIAAIKEGEIPDEEDPDSCDKESA